MLLNLFSQTQCEDWRLASFTFILNVAAINNQTRNDVDTFKNGSTCSFIVESTKNSCDFSILLKDTIECLFNVNKIVVSSDDCIKVNGQLSIDGSGSHKICHQLAEADEEEEEQRKNDSNYLEYSGINMKVKNLVAWTNILPNSTM